MLNDKWVDTTLVYVRRDGKTLLLERNKRKVDMHGGRFVGLGGKFISGETPHQCMVREVFEESGLNVIKAKLQGLIHFPLFDGERNIRSYLYEVTDFDGELIENDEGSLHWVPDESVFDQFMWEGDRLFLDWFYQDKGYFESTFIYENKAFISYDVTWEVTMNPTIKITMENGEYMLLELYKDVAPETVDNFLKLVEDHFYDGLIFHRVIEGFMIQGGCPQGTGTGGPGWNIKGEFTQNGFANNLRHTRGVISMARSMNPNSAGSQFFIMHQDSPHLDGSYAGFGELKEGFETLDAIATTPTGMGDKPISDQRIKTIEVLEK